MFEEIFLEKKENCETAFDIEITVTFHGEVIEKHYYYKVYLKEDLVKGFSVANINGEEISFEMDESDQFTLKKGESKRFHVGHSPYDAIYEIKVVNIRYGRSFDL